MTLYNSQFPFFGNTLFIDSKMDEFYTYRKAFKNKASQLTSLVQRDYKNHVRNLDEFFSNFPKMYCHYRNPVIDSVIKLFMSYDIYDISKEQFEEFHNKKFCTCNLIFDDITKQFNDLIVANQNRKIRNYNMLPGVFFSGITGIVAATAVNVAVTNMMESSIRNANVSRSQRIGLFNKIDKGLLFERVHLDYWYSHLSMFLMLQERGVSTWYVNGEIADRAEGMMNNLKNNLVPKEKVKSVLLQILQTYPIQEGLFQYLNKEFPGEPEIIAINNYFGYDGNDI